MTNDFEMVELFREELLLCAVKPDETVIVLKEGEVRADYARCFLLAARSLGANAFGVTVPPRTARSAKTMVGRTAIEGNTTIVDVLKTADLIIDLMGMLFSAEQNQITASGTRVLMVREPFDVLREMFPTKQLRHRVEYGEQLLGSAKVMRITSPGGTDIEYTLGDYPVLTQYGYVDTPGRWDHFATGQVLTQGNDGTVKGTVVLMPGDFVLTFRKYLEQPVTLRIDEGYVTGIEGKGLDAELLRGYMESFNDPRAYAVSHIGWGLSDKAKWYHAAITRQRDEEIGANSLSFYGNVLFSLGPNTELGGSNDTACHLDIPMRNASLWLDGTPIVTNGDIVVPEMKA
ncbi:MAG: leucyl aminopeptidase [Acetobacter sp.]|uniref:leucyl aminopeptidase n=1 Tax=Acetobacter sp. TaxID=440 RepID=UPI0039EB054B